MAIAFLPGAEDLRPRRADTRASQQQMRIVTIIDPGVKADPAYTVYQEGVAKGYLCDTDGAPFQGWVWPGLSCWAAFPRATSGHGGVSYIGAD